MSKEKDTEHSEITKLLDLLFAEKDSRFTSGNDDGFFRDNTQTQEQNLRDQQITKLLKKYVEAYETKIKSQKLYRKTLFWVSVSLVIVFSVLIAGVSILTVFTVRNGSIDTTTMVSVITICVTLLTSIIGLVQIITKFCFPENDEQYITTIVDSIQKNDLEHKKANINACKKPEEKDRGDSGGKTED